MISNRIAMPLLLAGLLGSACAMPVGEAASDTEPAVAAGETLDETAVRAIEERIGGRVGVAVVDADGTHMVYRADERFAMCSTFKLALAAAVLERTDVGAIAMDEELRFDESDLLAYAPVSREHVAQGRMTVDQAAEAISILSDNTAANLLLERIGGPAALTEYFRRHGDAVTRLDRMEPGLNENAVGDDRDTTTPAAMAGLVHRLMFGDALSPASREQLAAWAVANRTGDDRIRAGVPAGWRVGDKTGNCGNAYNDIGIVWPPGDDPFVLTVYVDRATAPRAQIDAAIAEIGRLAAAR